MYICYRLWLLVFRVIVNRLARSFNSFTQLYVMPDIAVNHIISFIVKESILVLFLKWCSFHVLFMCITISVVPFNVCRTTSKFSADAIFTAVKTVYKREPFRSFMFFHVLHVYLVIITCYRHCLFYNKILC